MKTISLYLFLSLCLWYAGCTPQASDIPDCSKIEQQLKTCVALFDDGKHKAADSLACLTASAALKSNCPPLVWAKARTLMAEAEMALYNREGARDSLLADLAYAQKYHPEVAGIFHFWLGYIYYINGEFWQAYGHYEAARSAHENGKIPVVNSNVGHHLYKPLANIYTRLGENNKAINLLQIARDSSTRQADLADIPEIYCDLGRAFMNNDNLDAACANYDAGLRFSLSKPAGDDNRIAGVRAQLLGNWAEARWRSGDPDSARVLANKSLEYDPQNSETFMILGETEAGQGRFGQADNYFRQAESYYRSNGYTLDRELAKVLLRRAKLTADRNFGTSAALNLCNEALHFVIPGFKAENADDNPDPALFYPENTILEALDLKSGILWNQYVQNGQDPALLRLADTTLSLALHSADVLTATYGFESSVLNSLEYVRALHERCFNILFERHLRLHEPETPARIVAFSERSRALLLRQKLADDAALQTSGLPAPLIKREHLLRSELTEQRNLLAEMEADGEPPEAIEAQKRRIFKLEDERGDLNKKMRSLAGASSGDPGSLASLQKIRTQLPSDSALLVEYFYNANTGALYQIGITRHDVRLSKHSLSEANIEAFIAFVRDEAAAKSRTDSDVTYRDQFVAEARMLYDSLLSRVALDMPLRELIVVPDGILGAFPFDLLLKGPVAAQASFRELPYLFRDVAVRFTPSATVLMEGSNRIARTPADGYFGVAPAYKSKTFPWVEYGSDCVSSLRNLFGGQYLEGYAATKDRFRELAPRCQILHFYGHGRADNITPGRSYLALTSNTGDSTSKSDILAAASQLPPEEIPNVLYAQEISLMHLNADLVVLSACETGVGKIVGGEGVFSLARAFLDAGCPSAAMTLWSVDDEATDQLTQSFLRHIREGKRKDIALQLAKKEFLESGKSAAPYFWSGFVLTGDAGPVKSGSEDCYFAARGQTYSCGTVWATFALLAAVLALLAVIFRYR